MYGLLQQDKMWHICNYFENLESDGEKKNLNIEKNPL